MGSTSDYFISSPRAFTITFKSALLTALVGLFIFFASPSIVRAQCSLQVNKSCLIESGTSAVSHIDSCGDGDGPSKDIQSLSASFDESSQYITVEMTLCEPPDTNRKTKYHVKFDYKAPFATDLDRNDDGYNNSDDVCFSTSDDGMMHRVNKDNGPGQIAIDSNVLTYWVSLGELDPNLAIGDTILLWADIQNKGIQDRAPDTDGSDGCAKPERETEVLALTLTPSVPMPSDACEANIIMPSCETIVGQPDTLTFVYTGGGCAGSVNSQGSKTSCSGSIDPSLAVIVPTSAGQSFTVNPDETFTITNDGSNTVISLSNAGGTETIGIHTSCSAPLEVGDVFGSITLVAINDESGEVSVTYGYEIENLNDGDVTITSVFDDQLGELLTGPTDILDGRLLTLSELANINKSTTNTVVVNGKTPGGVACAAGTDALTVTVTPAN